MRGKLPLKSWDGDPNTPRGMMDKTSPEWVRRTIERLRWSLEQVKTTEEEYVKTLNELRDSQAWKILNYPGLEEMLTAETGMDSAERSRRVMGQHGGERPGSGRNPKLLNSHVDPDGKTDQNQVDNVNLKTQGGNHSTYLRARLQRDHPEILERLEAGEFPSVRAAAIEAGIVEPSFNCPCDPVKAARRLLKHFQGERLDTLLAELRRVN